MTFEDWLGCENELGLSIVNKKYRRNNESFPTWLQRVSGGDPELKRLILTKKFLLGGRSMANRGIDSPSSYFNCYSSGFVEDSYYDIMQTAMNIGLTFKGEGGQGISLSKLRPQGTPVGKQYTSDGIVPFMRIYNEVTAGTSQGGCVEENELVLTDKGYKPIKSIEIGDMVLSKVGYVPVDAKWDKGIQDIYEVTTSKGYSIKTTFDHKFCVDGFTTKHLSELNIGDNICLITKNSNFLDIDKMAYIAAHFMANGYFSPGCDCGYITISDRYQDIVNRIVSYISDLGFESRYSKKDCENAFRITITAPLGRALKEYGVVKNGAGDMHIPDAVLYSDSEDIVWSYLAGCIDSDGCVKKNTVCYTTICKRYAEEVAAIMKRCGFFPSVCCEKRDEPKHDLYTVSDTIRLNTIALPSTKVNHKQITTSNSRYLTPYTMDNTGLKPSASSHLSKISRNSNIGLFTYLNCQNAPYQPMIFDSIVSIAPAGQAHVYDIGLESEHMFFCNGIYVSNSRKGALMLSIDARHKEAETFIHIKSQEGMIEKANLSLEIDDEFMEAVRKYYKTGEIVTIHEKRNYSGHVIEYDVVPIEIFKALVDNCYDWADPAALFTNRLRNYNLMQYDDEYQIETTNPCGEQPLPKHGACCLASINMSEFVKNPYTEKAYFDTSEFVEAVKIGVKTLDKLIDENYYRHPLKEQQEMSYNYRNIGLGVFGYATALMKLGIRYGSDEALDWTDAMFGLMFRAAVIESNRLASELGPFPKYKDCVWDSDIMKAHFPQEEIDRMRQTGLRNCSLLSIAPTGSIGTMLGESGGCEPEFAIKYTRRTVGMTDGENTYFTVFCKAAREFMDVNKTDILPPYFVSSADIPWPNRIKTQAVMQKHVDTGISSTVNLPNTATKDDIAMLYLMAWEEGLKGVTIFRDGCKRIPILSTDKKEDTTENVGSTVFDDITKLPRGYIIEASDNLIGKKRKLMTGCGSLHCTAFFDPETGDLMETYLSKGSTGGCNNFMIGLSRMISLAARSGCNIDSITDQLNSSGACPSYAVRTATRHDTSKGSCCPVAIANALKDMWQEIYDEIHASDAIEEKDEIEGRENEIANTASNDNPFVCPQCGEPIVHEGGCDLCKNCGWSKCN